MTAPMPSHLSSSSRAPRGLTSLAALFVVVAAAVGGGCGSRDAMGGATERSSPAPGTGRAEPEAQGEGDAALAPSGEGHASVVDTRPPPMHAPVPLYEDGRSERQVDAATARENGLMVLDLGEEWTPYLFSERDQESEAPSPNDYRRTYLALARGEFPNDYHGERAREDKYLEIYGIMPTLGLLRARMERTRDLACEATLDLEPLRSFTGFVAYESRNAGRDFARRFRGLESAMSELARAQGVERMEDIDASRIRDDRVARRLAEYRRLAPQASAIRALQARLECEGYFEGKGEWSRGGFDWATHEALAEFERRHRVYGWGALGRETLEELRRTPLEGDREGVIRVLTERAMHAAGVLEDGSVTGRYRDASGTERDLPNLEAELRAIVIRAFGLETPESTLAFLESLGELGPEAAHPVALTMPTLPDYYTADMDLSVEIDRGDVWYEFPFDEQGRERPQPVERRPRITILTTWNGQRIRLARYGTTIGGWRSEQIDGRIWWRYKNSPVGPVVWHQIVAAPVWIPPESTPPRSLFRRTGRGGRDAYRPNYHETGPSYASAYGLVAAYHINYRERDDGSLSLRGDEGIRTHGSVDYMSIMRRHSHGCHRLHNHIAVRLMSFMLAHRPHTRVGQQRIAFHRDVEIDGNTYGMDLTQGGYVYQLASPIPVNVLEGRIRGERSTPIEEPLPRFDPSVGAYVLPDGSAVTISRQGRMTPTALPSPDAGVPTAPAPGGA